LAIVAVIVEPAATTVEDSVIEVDGNTVIVALVAKVVGSGELKRTSYWPGARFAAVVNVTVPPVIGLAGAAEELFRYFS
jgi:hypothetical protein